MYLNCALVPQALSSSPFLSLQQQLQDHHHLSPPDAEAPSRASRQHGLQPHTKANAALIFFQQWLFAQRLLLLPPPPPPNHCPPENIPKTFVGLFSSSLPS